MRVIAATALLLLGVAQVWATPEEMERLHKVVEMKATSKLFKAECMTCHTDVPSHNPFGKDVAAAIKSKGGKGFTPAVWNSLAKLDSDQDGWSNAAEIKADTYPGNKNDFPAGSPDLVKADSGAVSETALVDQLVPKHSFHPVIIHFPIALFLFGTGLEILGWRKRDTGMRRAGWWALLFGTLATAVAVPTGIAALIRNGYGWQGPALVHAIIAISATILMILTTLWRRKGELESKTYFALLVITALAVGAAGHFGGQLVYGN